MKKFLATQKQCVSLDIVLLLIRLTMGLAFMIHGYGKIQTPFSWMGQAPVPGFLQGLSALAEFGGGAALYIRVFARLGALGLTINMIVACCVHIFMFHDPFVNPGGGRGYELAVAYLMLNLVVLAVGPGRFSIDKKIFG